MLHQHPQQLEFLERELQRLSVQQDLVAGDVELKVFEFVDRLAGAGVLPAAQDGTDPRHQLQHAERLGDVVLRAEVQPGHLVGLRPAGREQDDREAGRFRVLFQAAQGLEPVHAGEHDVQQEDVRQAVPQRGKHGGCVLKARNLQPAGFQRAADDFAHVLLVLDHKSAFPQENTPLYH